VIFGCRAIGNLLSLQAAPMSNHPANDVLKELDTLLAEVILLQRDGVAELCAQCEDVCCSRVQFLFDEKDTIYQKLSGRKPPRRREGTHTRGCRFLTAAGCSLEPRARPFTCHRYICPALGRAMAGHDSALTDLLEQKFTAMDHLRSRLWELYLEARDPLLFRLQLRK
jgi:hypothetical protein